ncbi:potassium channel family protein [Pseudomonas mandelii]|uniref:potassium channel family protein n=1 Tax=Pseudomonas mandelii TaxID=75612 RepID=UPI00224AA519|nr:potassium channel family protein [Pseudomonas mandelii]MCX2896995.1 potassium channel family protein [Pseudomonas mandelii]
MKANHASNVRREFFKATGFYLRVVWPIISVLVLIIIGSGLIIGYLEDWKALDGIYFAFVTGFTIGYGELVPKLGVSRVLAILLGFNGVLMTAIFAAVSVRAIEVAVKASVSDSASGSEE